MHQVEIAIIGGGMVGAAAALALADTGFDVAVVEKVELPALATVQPCETRASALTPASQQFLSRLKVWEVLQPYTHPFTSMRVSSEDVATPVVFSAQEVGADALGWLVPNRAVQAALWSALREKVTLFSQRKVAAIQPLEQGAIVTLDDGTQLHAKLVIGADGAHSKVRQLAHIPMDAHEYGQAAIVGCVRTEKPHQDACWQHYTATGPVAFLAMQHGISSLAWYVPEARLPELLALDDDAFCKALTEASQGLLGQVTWAGPRAGFPLVRRHAQSYSKGPVVLVGDAAHTVHPQAGQGVNLGFLDVIALVETLQEARAADIPWWHEAVLHRYGRRRYGDNLLVQRAMDGFDSLFRQDFPWKKPLRQGVMQAGARLELLRTLLTEVAMTGRFEA